MQGTAANLWDTILGLHMGPNNLSYVTHYLLFFPLGHIDTILGLHMGPNNLCYVTHHLLFFPYVAMSLFIRPSCRFLQFL